MSEMEIKTKWPLRNICEICQIIAGQSPPSSTYNDKGIGLPFFQGKADFGEIYPNTRLWCNKPLKISKKYDILLSVRAPVGPTNICKTESCIGRGLSAIRAGSYVYYKYLFYFFRSIERWLKDKGIGSTFTEITQSEIKNIEMPLPPLRDQEQIAKIFDMADGLCRKRQQAMELLDEFLRSTFLEMFGDPVKNNKNWPVAKLYEVSSIQSGVTKGRKLNGKQILSVPYMRVANVQDGYINITDLKYIEALPSDIEKYKLLYNDILLTEGGDPDKLGRGAIWKYYIKDCVYQNHIFRVRVHPDILNPEYFSALIGSGYGKRYFLKSAKQTTGIASINATQLKNFPVLIPPMKLQENFSRVIGAVESIREKMQKSREEMENLFNSLMQRAFKGELQINEKGDGAR